MRVRVRRKRLPRRWKRYTLIGVGAIVLFGALGLIPANAARRSMGEGRAALEGAKTALLAGDAGTAEDGFARAEDAFVRARGHARNPLLALAGVVPILGRTPDAATALADAGREVARAGSAIAAGIAALPDGVGSLGPQGGRIPVAPFRELVEPLERATAHLRRAEAIVDPIATSWLLGPVSDARLQLEAQLEPLSRSMEAAAVIVARFPDFLGADAPRRYLFATENPAELRGTGGLVGSVSVMTAEEGHLSFAPFEPATDFPRLPAGRVEPPNDDYARLYPDGSRLMSVVNLTPDFPSVAAALEGIYEASRGVEVDGVISADPLALQAMLKVSGPVTAPVLGPVTAENVVPLITNRAYTLLPDPDARKRLLGEVAQLVLSRFLQGAHPADAAKAVIAAASDGHLKLHADDAQLQRGLALAGANGALPPRRGDVVAPIVNNGAGNKIDFYAERTVGYRVQLGAENTARADLRMEIHNGAPDRGQPRYVIGPYNASLSAGENVSLISMYLPEGTEVLEYLENGQTAGAGVDTELGYVLLPSSLSIPSGGSGSVDYALGRSDAWEGTTSRGTYRLTLLDQPTIIPTQIRVEVRAPGGTRIVRTNVPMEVAGNSATWEGRAAGGKLVFEIEFQKPLWPRAWDALTRFFRTRLIEF